MVEPELVKLYWILEGERSSLSFKDLYAEKILGPLELARWNGMRFEKRRNEFLLGRYAAKKLLTSRFLSWAGKPYTSLQILNEEDGAPYLSGSGDSGSISISHREDTAVAAYSQNKAFQIGIDLELIESREWSFVEDFFTPREARFVKGMSPSWMSTWVTLVWSAKEAVLKSWHQGLRMDTRSIEIQRLHADDFDKLARGWVEIDSRVNKSSFPRGKLFGRVLGGLVITLAVTNLADSQVPGQIELIRVEV
jgi:4'-phosphopantetheinyl transferase